MGKSLSSTTRFREFARIASSNKLRTEKLAKPTTQIRVSTSETAKSETPRVNSGPVKPKKMDNSEDQNRLPLAHVVSDCVKRWFDDTLKAAKAGDTSMQVLVGQMYCSGYGFPKDDRKGNAWISRASRTRASAWKLSDKHPGYNASDSNSDEIKSEAK